MCFLYVVVVVVIVSHAAVTSGFQHQGGRKKRTAKRPMTERQIEQRESCSVLSMRLHALNWPHVMLSLQSYLITSAKPKGEDLQQYFRTISVVYTLMENSCLTNR